MHKRPSIWFALILVGLLSACGAATSTAVPAATTAALPVTTAPATRAADSATTAAMLSPTTAAMLSGTTMAMGSSATTAAATTAAMSATTAAAGAATTAAMMTGTIAADAPTAAVSYGSPLPGNTYAPPPTPQLDQQPIKAGQVDDNLKFDEYRQYISAYHDAPVLPFDVTERYIISVVDGNARTVANATVQVFDGQTLIFTGKTYSNGQMLFFPRAFAAASQSRVFSVVAQKDGRSVAHTFTRADPTGQDAATLWTLQMTGSLRPQIDQSPNLDILFLIDSTGSMGGEIQRIQQTINDIAYQIGSLPNTPKARYGVVTYRDRGDIYLTRKFGFTTSLGDFSTFLNSISAGGGGDYPESLNEALHVTINDMDWNTADSVRLTFLVADAPPHLDYPNDYAYTTETVAGMGKGIKIYTIGASGLNAQGEYIFRQMAQMTLAQYLFITRGGDENNPGSGGPASNTGTVYVETDLNRIIVNIVRRELTNLTQ